MKAFLLSGFILIGLSHKSTAQVALAPGPTVEIQNYYTPEKQKEIVANLQKTILDGCTKALPQQPAYPADELQFDVEQVKTVLQSKFSKSFAENPEIETKLNQSLDAIASDSSCTAAGNDCRSRLIATATYYFQMLRPNVPSCDGYVKYDYTTPSARKKRAEDNGYIKECETELKLRYTRLSYYGSSNGGMDQRGAYTDILTNELNAALMQIQQGILTKTTDKKVKKGKIVQLSKSREEISICGDVEYGTVYSYPLRTNLYKEAFAGFNSDKKPEAKPEPKKEPCVEEIKVLHEEFVPLNFSEGSSTVGNTQVKPVKEKIEAFVQGKTGIVITDIQVTSSSSKTPYLKTEGGKKVYDKDYSDRKNLELAEKRAGFAKISLGAIISENPDLDKASYSATGAINGPDYSAEDANLKSITSKDSNYKTKIEALYSENKNSLAKEAMIKSSSDLMDEARFTNLYDAKFKPYQGFKITIKGFSKNSRKCPEENATGTAGKASANENDAKSNSDSAAPKKPSGVAN